MADMSKIMAALGGFGAGYQGQGAQYLEGIQREKLLGQQEQDRAQELDKERVAMMVKDAWTVNKLLDEDKFPVALKLLDSRIDNIKRLKGDPSDTQAIKDALVSGDPAKVAQARQEIKLFADAGIADRVWEPPVNPEDTLEGRKFKFEQDKFAQEQKFKKDEFDWKKTRPISEAEGGSTAPAKNLAIYERLVREGNPNAERFAYASGLAGRDIDSRVTLAGREAEAKDTSKYKAALFDSINNGNRTLNKYEMAIAQIDKGAESGPVMKMLPSMQDSTLLMDTIRKDIGMEIVGSGILGVNPTDADVKLAMETAIPEGLRPDVLKKEIQRRAQVINDLNSAQREYYNMLDSGKTKGDILRMAEEKRRAKKDSPTVSNW